MSQTRLYMGKFVLVFLLALAGTAAGQEPYRVTMDKPFYTYGESILITVQNDTVVKPLTVVLSIFDAMKFPTPVAARRAFEQGDNGLYVTFSEDLERGDDNVFGIGMKESFEWELPVGRYFVVTGGSTMDEKKTTRIQVHELEIVRRPDADLLIRTTKSKYKKGETVKTYVLNRFLSQKVKMPSTNPWAIYQRAAHANGGAAEYRKTVYTVQIPGPVTLAPKGGREMWNWHQKDQRGDRVTVGKYSVQVTLLRGVRDQKTVYERYFSITR